MKRHSFLYIAIIFALFILTNGFIRILIGIISVVYFFKHYQNKFGVLLILFLFSSFLLNQSVYQEMNTRVLEVQEVRSSYVIASNKDMKCILYNVENVNLNDVIEVKGKYENIYSQKNRETFQFFKLCERRGIYQSMNVISYRLKSKSNGIRAKIFSYISNYENKEVKEKLLSLFYHIQEEDQKDMIFASGLHISFLSYFLSKIFHQRKEKVDLVVSFLYFIFFPKTVFIIRIFFFALVTLICSSFDKRDQLAISVIALLSLQPSYIFEVGFQIPVLFRFIYLFDRVHIPNSLKAFLILFPYQLFIFHECYPIKILFFSIYRIIGGLYFCVAVLTLLFPFMYPLFLMLFMVQTNIEFFFFNAFIIIGKPYFIWIVLWGYFTLLYLSNYKRKFLLIYIILIGIQCNLSKLHPLGEVTYLDVGQGDSIFIREAMNGETMLIDVAGKRNQNLPEKSIYPYLKMEGIKQIDKVIITHDDFDHSGGLKQLKKLIKVKEVIRVKKDEVCMKKICFYNVGRQVYNDKNDNSIVLYARIGSLDYMFMGDASTIVEKNIMKEYNRLNCDILKIGHHGSNTSTSKDFVLQMNPLLSIISSGKNNFYGHPHREVVNLLEKNNTKILNTQEDGSITIFFSPFINLMRTGSDEFGIID